MRAYAYNSTDSNVFGTPEINCFYVVRVSSTCRFVDVAASIKRRRTSPGPGARDSETSNQGTENVSREKYFGRAAAATSAQC